MNDAPLGLLFAILFLLIACSAFFSSSETGMMSLNRYRLKHLKKQNHTGATRASNLLDTPDRLISLILIGNNLVNFTASAIVTVIGFRLAGDAGIAAATFVFTMIVLIFAEITPKTVAAIEPERIAFPASAVLVPLLTVFQPIVWLINKFTNLLLRQLRVDIDGAGDQLSTDELRTIVGEAGPHIPEQHQAMLLNILDLEQLRVDEIMIQDQDIYCLDLTASDEELLQRIRDCEYARVPVIDNSIDNMLGLLSLRLVPRFLEGDVLDRDALLELLREPYFIPESTPLHTQLLAFQKTKRRLAIVVNEYGEIRGLTTLEDILEEIVGEFTSNLAETNEEIVEQADGLFRISGTSHIRDINKQLDWELPLDGPRTLSGLLVEFLEAFPDAEVGVKIGDYLFEVREVDEKIIRSVIASYVG